MEKYNYQQAIKADVRSYIENNYKKEEIIERIKNDREDLEEELNDKMWVADEVTGNASGSYTFNTWDAEENICHNLDLLAEAAEEFGGDIDVLKEGAEACDVTIRCYLLRGAISEVLNYFENEE